MLKYRRLDFWAERACHLAAVAASVIAAFLLRFDCSLPDEAVGILKQALLIAVVVKLPVFDLIGFYRGLRRYVSLPDLYLVFLGNLAGSVLFATVSMMWLGGRMPRSVVIIDSILCFIATGLIRFSVRICKHTFGRDRSALERTGILIYGAGTAGAELAREIRSDPMSRYEVKGFLDDDPIKQRALIMGVAVVGNGRQAASVVSRLNRTRKSVSEIIIAMPRDSGPEMREALSNCHAAQVPCKTIPALRDLLNGTVLTAQVRSLSVQDLLGRQPVRLDRASVRAAIAGKIVLVTGAAGSIGSELCRQIAQLGPERLVALDQNESELFKLENALRQLQPKMDLTVALADIRDADRLADIFDRNRIHSIFHAAAYKHVPMMESNVIEAAKNNILGTWNVARAARNVNGVFMISTDKAVNPICVMGATKRICERIVTARQASGRQLKRGSVRFGNVLGSNGSVVPIFQAQIAAGGPVKVTHPDARRYFMTISEAVSLVLEASVHSTDAEIFVLDMGEPIRIVDLAENMIRLAGKVPYEDIDIQFTGLRPGEKLVEELGERNGARHSHHDKVRTVREEPLDGELIGAWIDELSVLIKTRNERAIVSHLQLLVPEYEPASTWAATTQALALKTGTAGVLARSSFLAEFQSLGSRGPSEAQKPIVQKI